MASDVMRVRLHLRQVRVLAVASDTPSELRVRVESTVRRPRCPHCGFKCHRVHDTRERSVRDLEVSGRRTTLVWVRRRLVCGGCDSRWLEEHPEFDGRLTRRLAQRLVADAQVMTIRAVVRRHGVSWPSVNALVRAWSGLVAEHRRSRRCRVLLVDETSMRKRHRYVTVIVNADTGRTLAMVEHRSSAALSAFLMSQPHKWRRGVKVVVTDGSRAYKASVDACLPCARHVLDRFHVIRWFCAGLTAARRDIQRREPHGVKPAFAPEVFRARFLLLRRGDTLTGADQARLDALFDTHPRLKAGWQALQELHGLYLAHLAGIERSPNTVRAYAHGLRLWFEFLGARRLVWDSVGVEDVSRFVAWLRAPADNVIVFDDTAAVRSAATANRHLAALFGFYDFHARSGGVGVAAELVAWRRGSRGSCKPFLHGIAGDGPVRLRPVGLRVPRRLPVTLGVEEIGVISAACTRLRDRFLFALLAETGMRVGQALGLRHEDFRCR